MARLTYSLALITLNCIEVRPEKLLTLLQGSHPLAGSNLEPLTENIDKWTASLVQVPTPIDMTDFWTTETMGVAAKPCECDADKLSAVERKELKITEDSCQKIGRQWPIPYPWKRDPKELPNNEVQAKKKMEATESCLSKHRSMQPLTTDKWWKWQRCSLHASSQNRNWRHTGDQSITLPTTR